MKKIFLIVLALLCSNAYAQVDVQYIGTPQVGIGVTQAQIFAKSVKAKNQWVSYKDCATALQAVQRAPHSAFLISNTATQTAIRNGINCVPEFKAEDVLYIASSYFLVCQKYGATKPMGSTRFTLGLATMLPVNGFSEDFNRRNNANMVGVSLPSSIHIANSVIAGDLDWGFITTGIAEPHIASRRLNCPYSTDPNSPNFIAKHFQMVVPNFSVTFVMVSKTSDPAVKEELVRAAQSKEMADWFASTKHVDVKTSGIISKDVNDWHEYNRLILDTFKNW
jgi:hypothetical protein